MADETLNITVVEDNGGTNKLVTAVNNLAKEAESLAGTLDKSAAASKNVGDARAAEAVATGKAATAVRGYVDETGTYVRLVGSQAAGVRAAADAQGSLTAALNATGSAASSAASGTTAVTTALSGAAGTGTAFSSSVAELNRQLAASGAASATAATGVRGFVDAQGNYIRAVGSQSAVTKAAYDATLQLGQAAGQGGIEAGRAAAGYGALNPVLTQAQIAARDLSAGLAGTATSVQAAGVGLGQVGAQGNAAAVGLANGRNAFQGISTAAAGIGAAGQTAATGLGAAGGAAGSAAPAVTAVGAAARAASTAANETAGAHIRLAQAFGTAGSAAGQLGGLLAGLGLAVGAGKIIEYADTWSSVQNKLRLVTTDQTKLNAIMDIAYGIAQKTKTPIADVANLYGKLSQSANQYRLTSANVATITESMSLAFQSSGASGVEAGRAITQFSQGLQKGKLEAQDFKSILESAPVVANAMQQGLRMIGVTVNGSLTEALSKGTVTAKQMLDALVAINPTLNTFASGAIPTVAGAMTQLDNAFQKYIGTANQGNSLTGTLISTMGLLANNMQIVVPVAVALGGLLAFGAVAGAISSIAGLAAAFGGIITAAGGALAALGALAGPVGLGAIALAVGVGIPLWNAYGGTVTAFVGKLLGLGPASASASASTAAAAASASSLSGALQTASLNATAANAEVAKTAANMNSAQAGTAAHTQAVNDNNAALERAKTAANQVEAARKALENQTQANAKAEADFKDRIEKQGPGFNAYGEKLKPISQFLAEARKAQEDWQKSLDASRETMLAASSGADGYNQSLAQLTQTTKNAGAAAQGMTGFTQQQAESIAKLSGSAQSAAIQQTQTANSAAELNAAWGSGVNQANSMAGGVSGLSNSLGQLAGSYDRAASSASGYASAAAQAAFENNTVKGQIGGGTLQGLDPTDFAIMQSAYGNGLSGLSPAELHADQLNRLSKMAQTNPYNNKIRAALEYEMDQGKSKDTLAQEATVKSAQNKAASMAALDAAGIDENGRPLKAGESNVKGNVGQSTTATTAAVPKVTAAASAPTSIASIGANNGASATASVQTMNVQTLNVGSMGTGAAANGNSFATAAANVPEGSTNQLQGAAVPTGGSTTAANSNGSLGPGVPVGTTVTSVVTQTGAMVDPSTTGRPSDDVLLKMNGGFETGPTRDPSIFDSTGGDMTPNSGFGSGGNFGVGDGGNMGVGPGGNMGVGPATINMVMNIKSDDFGQFKQSQRQIAMDIGTRVMRAAS